MYVIAILVLSLALLLAFCTVAILVLRQKSSLIFGIYPEKGIFYRVKYYIALVVLRRLRKKIFGRTKSADGHIASSQDRPQDLSSCLKSYDVVSFMGANKDGYRVLATVERRRRGILRVALYLWIPGYGLLTSPKLPDMMNFSTDGTKESEGFSGNGFNIFPMVGMRKWRLLYGSHLKHGDKLLSVLMDFEFEASSAAHFNYNRDLSDWVIADSIARESWNNEFLYMVAHVNDNLEKRTHYEQIGVLRGEIRFGQKSIHLEMKALRDHSFGTERCLSTINRYVCFTLFLDDGTSMVVGVLSQPSFFLSSLKVGYICNPQGVYQPISSCNFELYSYGEKGIPPNHQNFLVHTKECKYFVQISVDESAIRYVGSNWQSKVYDQFVSCTVNGVSGHGIAEYLYRNRTGRPVEYSSKDPMWYQRIRSCERSPSCGDLDDDREDEACFS